MALSPEVKPLLNLVGGGGAGGIVLFPVFCSPNATSKILKILKISPMLFL
jgi:hypothetical protein